jgi:hypothetical protein
MLSGFNTDVTHNGTIYHVQTEPRKQASIETAVYVKGAVIHSLRTSFESLADAPGNSEDKLKELLEDQHRQVIAKIRAGEIKEPAASGGG